MLSLILSTSKSSNAKKIPRKVPNIPIETKIDGVVLANLAAFASLEPKYMNVEYKNVKEIIENTIVDSWEANNPSIKFSINLC